MTYQFTELEERAGRLYAAGRRILDVASDALDAAGVERSGSGAIARRFVSPVPPPWDSPMLTVFPARVHLGLPGVESFAAPPPGDATWALQSVNLAVQIVVGGFPISRSQCLDETEIDRAAQHLMFAAWAVFIGIIQAQDSDQLPQCQSVALGAGDSLGQAQAGYVGFSLLVSSLV